MEYLSGYEESLERELAGLCSGLGYCDGQLLHTDDLDMKWKEIAPEYMADAVREVNAFPEAAIAWAGYIGMAMAKWWDEDWGRHHGVKYTELYGPRGFDDMDDHIMQDILGYKPGSAEAGAVSNMLMACTQASIARIRHENIEPGSIMAFHVLARTVKAMFRTGVSIQLKKLGYRIEKIDLSSAIRNKRYS